MIETILGSENAERVLIYLLVRGKGYASEIADYFNVDLSPIQKQLLKFESGGVLVSTLAGRTRIFQFNPSYAFLSELKELLNKAFQFYPPEEVEQLKMNRRRPHRTGKPL
ncbi:MAG: winged helix-turn-helix domain-containing protein [Anaerolineaceae bacterium]|nr:winged helix-turn-helix domain-containing protein [Anaerolineaceae bacterium]